MSIDYPINFWITHLGEIVKVECDSDHNLTAGLYVKKHHLIYEHTVWATNTPHAFQDYKAYVLFCLRWVRVNSCRSWEDGIAINIGGKLNEYTYSILKEYVKNTSSAYYCLDISGENNVDKCKVYGEKDYKKMLNVIYKIEE